MDVQALSPEVIQDVLHRSNDSIAPELIAETFSSNCIDLVSAPLNSRILAFSDEFFASASNLINPRSPIHKPGVFVHSGAWYDGWETRRHNSAPFDWVIIRLGVTSGRVKGVEIDTAFFTGNHAPEIRLDGCFETGEDADDKVAKETFRGWEEVLGRRECGPSRRQAWTVAGTIDANGQARAYTHVRLCMFPDGGISRFRLYGQAVPVWPEDSEEVVEMSAAVMGGVAVKCSDQHYGGKENLLLPGRGVDMGDGWETKRSRGSDHVDWVIVRLGARAKITKIVIDTAHFRGNFPQGVRVDAIDAESQEPDVGDGGWEEILDVQKPGPDREHEYGGDVLKGVEGKGYTHAKLTILPDGGVKRFRVFGTRA